MSKEERQALLHEGVTVTTTMSAYGMLSMHVYLLKAESITSSGDCIRQFG